MNPLYVTIRIPGEKTTTYSFRSFPVHIGRMPDCHLSVCHEAVSRHLCSVWLESTTGRIRVEPKPDVTNPMVTSKGPVTAPLVGSSLSFDVGPVHFDLSTTAPVEGRPAEQNKTRVVVLAVASAVMLLLVAWTMASPQPRGQGASLADLLPTALPQPTQPTPPKNTPASVLVQRAHMLLLRRPLTPELQYEAIDLYAKAAQIDRANRDAYEKQWRALHRRLDLAYRKQRIRLLTAWREDDAQQAAEAADRLRHLLRDPPAKTKKVLDAIVNRGGAQ